MVKKSFVLIVKCTIKSLIAYNESREFYKPYYVLSYVERKKKKSHKLCRNNYLSASLFLEVKYVTLRCKCK